MVRVVEQVQIRKQILDFLPFIELVTVDDLIRQAPPTKRMLQRSGEVVHAAKDREIARPQPLGLDGQTNRLDDLFGFLVAVLIDPQNDRFAFLITREQALGLSPPVVANQLVSDAQNVRRAAIILLQPNRFDRRVILFEIENIIQIGPPPAIDRLVGITGDGEVRVVDGKGPDDRVLCQVGVLVFVDHDVAKPGVELLTDLRVFAKQHRDVQQQVVKVDRIGAE